MLAVDLIGVSPEFTGIVRLHIEQIGERDFGADHRFTGNDVLKDEEKAVFSGERQTGLDMVAYYERICTNAFSLGRLIFS